MRRLMLLMVLVGAVIAISADTASAGWRRRCGGATGCCGTTGYWGGSGCWSRTCGWWGQGYCSGLAYSYAPAPHIAYQAPVTTCTRCGY